MAVRRHVGMVAIAAASLVAQFVLDRCFAAGRRGTVPVAVSGAGRRSTSPAACMMIAPDAIGTIHVNALGVDAVPSLRRPVGACHQEKVADTATAAIGAAIGQQFTGSRPPCATASCARPPASSGANLWVGKYVIPCEKAGEPHRFETRSSGETQAGDKPWTIALPGVERYGCSAA